MASDVTFKDAITERIEYLEYVAFYLVDVGFRCTPYRPLWFGFESAAERVAERPTVGHGALLRLRWVNGAPIGDEYYYWQFAGLKRVVGDMLDSAVFDVSATWSSTWIHCFSSASARSSPTCSGRSARD